MKQHFLTLVLLSLFSSLFAEDVKSNFMSESWSQTFPYNNLVPAYLPAGSEDGEFQEKWKGHVVAGCVATAMAQTMHYWQWPRQFDASANISHTVNIDKGKYLFGVEHTIARGVPLVYDDTPESKARITFIAATLGELAFDRDGTGGYVNKVVDGLVNSGLYVRPTYYDNTQKWDLALQMLKYKYPVPATIPTHAVVLDGWKREDGVLMYHLNNGQGGSGDQWVTRDKLSDVYPCFPRKKALLKNLPVRSQLPLKIEWYFPEGFKTIYLDEFEGFDLVYAPAKSENRQTISLGRDVRSYSFEKLENGVTYDFDLIPRFKTLDYADPSYELLPEKTSVTTTIDASAPAAPTLTAPKTFSASLTGCSFKLTGSETISSLALTTSLKSYTLEKTTYNLADYVSIDGEKGDYTVKIKTIDFLKNSDNYNVVFTFAGDDNNGATAYAETIVNFSAANTGNNSGKDPEEKPGTDPEENTGTDPEKQPDYILISPKNFVGYWQEYIAARKAAHPDMTFAIKDAAEIYAEYKDLTPAEKIKEYIASRVKGGTKYIVLGGAWSNITTDDGKSEESFIVPGENGDKYGQEALSLDNTIPGFTETFGGKTLATDYLYALIDEDNKPDVVVSRIPLVPWPKADGSVSSFSDIIAGYAKKVAAVEDAAFKGTHRYACAGAQLGSTVARGSAYWPTERHQYADGYYDFYDAEHPDSVTDGMIAARRRFRDYFAKYNPVKGAMVIPLGNAATDFFADKSGWEAIVAKCHGLEGEAYQTGITDTLFRETSTILKFGIFAMPCLTGRPDRTTAFGDWKTMRYPSMGVAAICNPNGGEVVGFHNTHDGAGKNDVALVTTCGDPYATQYEGLLLEALFKPNEKGERLNAGDAWKKAHCDYIEKFGSGTWHLWTAYESILYGDPLVAPSAVNEPVCGEGAVPARVLFK